MGQLGFRGEHWDLSPLCEETFCSSDTQIFFPQTPEVSRVQCQGQEGALSVLPRSPRPINQPVLVAIIVPCYWASFQRGEPDVSECGILVGASCGEKASQPPPPPPPNPVLPAACCSVTLAISLTLNEPLCLQPSRVWPWSRVSFSSVL